jgi:hypothetical protein
VLLGVSSMRGVEPRAHGGVSRLKLHDWVIVLAHSDAEPLDKDNHSHGQHTFERLSSLYCQLTLYGSGQVAYLRMYLALWRSPQVSEQRVRGRAVATPQ